MLVRFLLGKSRQLTGPGSPAGPCASLHAPRAWLLASLMLDRPVGRGREILAPRGPFQAAQHWLCAVPRQAFTWGSAGSFRAALAGWCRETEAHGGERTCSWWRGFGADQLHT